MIGTGLLLVQPALVEEVVFRGLLLPRKRRFVASRAPRSCRRAALAVYVASHPINARLFRPQVLGLFEHAVLVLATLLGLACTALFDRDRSAIRRITG
jgi:predicted Abi (CAAX) family protease